MLDSVDNVESRSAQQIDEEEALPFAFPTLRRHRNHERLRVFSKIRQLLDCPGSPCSRAMSVRGNRRHRSKGSVHTVDRRGHLVPRTAIEFSPARFRDAATPLLEKERHTCGLALVVKLSHPLWSHLASYWATFATYDDPVDAVERQFRNGPEQRLERKEAHSGRDSLQVRDSMYMC